MSSSPSAAQSVPHLDAVVTRDPATGKAASTLVNLHGEGVISCRIRGLGAGSFAKATLRTVNGDTFEAYNDIDRPEAVSITESSWTVADANDFSVDCPAHSVSGLSLE
jgi:alpha-L-arabinofuranosidase